jgi:hypothetical protein
LLNMGKLLPMLSKDKRILAFFEIHKSKEKIILNQLRK